MHGSRTDIDDLIAANLEKQGLTLSKTASKKYFLINLGIFNGLPPSPQQIEEFLQDTRPNAYELSIEIALLASKHFGERWGRHWLDGGWLQRHECHGQ